MNMRERVYMELQIEDRLKKAKELLDVQASDGNWNYDAYMQGMHNGMELIVAVMEDREPVFKKAPDQWLYDIKLPEGMSGDSVPTQEQPS